MMPGNKWKIKTTKANGQADTQDLHQYGSLEDIASTI
jgi:hypothetical protein